MNFKLGKLPKKLDSRNLRLATYIPETAVKPPVVDWSTAVGKWPLYQNDKVGDCTIAAAAHLLGLWSSNVGTGFEIYDEEVLRAYSAVSGYKSSRPETDTGAAMLDVLKYWRRIGIGGYRILAFAEINPRSRWEVQMALWLFGGIYAGFSLPKCVLGQYIWNIPSRTEDATLWGGHSVSIVQGDALGRTCVTWGGKQEMTNIFFEKYCDEAYAVISSEWVSGVGLSPAGFSLAVMLDDLMRIARR